MRAPYTLRRLGSADAASFRDVRLASLRAHPEAYGSAFEEEVDLPIAVFARQLAALPPSATYGGFDGNALVAVARLDVSSAIKRRHRGTIVGVYVDPAHRRTGLARRLVETIVVDARQHGLEAVSLSVSVGNAAARSLYVTLGFTDYGLHRRALKLGGAYVDEQLMAMELAGARAPPVESR